jgi:dUTP pyrophosphatase
MTPKFATAGAACFDLHAAEAGDLKASSTTVIGTGLSVEIPQGHVMLIFSRSGHGFKNGITLVNGTGVIDSDYRGEIKVGLRNAGQDPFEIKIGDRIAQAMILPLPQFQFVETVVLSDTERGSGGFGSTGSSALSGSLKNRG